MPTEHPGQHTFSKRKKSNSVGQHFGITCDGCQQKDISGLRYQCQQCDQSYDLCPTCFEKSKTIHDKSHKFQLIQDPLIRSNNRKLLARRALEYFCQPNTSKNTLRDPLSGWTRNDATKIIEVENEFMAKYFVNKEKFEQLRAEEAKREQEQQLHQLQMQLESQRQVDKAIRAFYDGMVEDAHQSLNRTIARMNGQTCPRCGIFIY